MRSSIEIIRDLRTARIDEETAFAKVDAHAADAANALPSRGEADVSDYMKLHRRVRELSDELLFAVANESASKIRATSG